MKYNIIILDEAHERSVYTDILFALVKKAVHERNGTLKLIVTSATLNTSLFSKYFDDCPVISMEGKCYPVDLKYENTSANFRLDESVNNAIRIHLHEGIGDILVFLTGSEECEQAVKKTTEILSDLIQKGKEVPSAMIYSLYGAQSSEDQARVFDKLDEDTRKIIYCTNIAETSITIDGVGFVIDSGYVKQKQYNPKTGMDCLMVVPISKVQAVQRSGRAGRTMPGKCLRMYSEKFFNEQMDNAMIPEILRVNLTNLILTLKCIGIDDVLRFDYMERPDDDLIVEALKQLHILNALNDDGKVNNFGREMCKLPLEPHFSKALLISKFLDCQSDILTLVSVLSSEKIWMTVNRTNYERWENFQASLKQTMAREGDHTTYLRVYRDWKESGRCEKRAKREFVNTRGLRQADNIREQLKQLIQSIDYKVVEQFLNSDHIYQLTRHDEFRYRDKRERFAMALCSSFFYNAARRLHTSAEEYILLSEGNVVNLDPNCAFAVTEHFPEYIIFSELAGNSSARGLVRNAEAVQENWITPYIQKIKKIKLEKIINKEKTREELVMLGKREKFDKMEQVRKESKDSKLDEAKLRFLQRKEARDTQAKKLQLV